MEKSAPGRLDKQCSRQAVMLKALIGIYKTPSIHALLKVLLHNQEDELKTAQIKEEFSLTS